MRQHPVRIAVDVMGGDFGPCVTVPSAARFASQNPQLSVILVGQESKIASLLSDIPPIPNLHIRHASDEVMMNERPASALRYKRGSSMAVALQMIANKEADVCVSAGNTGALMALSRSILRMLPGVDRPALLKVLSLPSGKVYLLDLGANIDCSAEHLYQYALMGCAYYALVENNSSPRVGLLNVGEEEIKGTEQVRLAARLISEAESIHYIGFIEGDQVFFDKADIVVCDGFVGNVALKTGEGMARMLISVLESSLKGRWYLRLLGWAFKSVIQSVIKSLDPGRYNGAILIGVQGIVYKSHGSADEAAFFRALTQAACDAERVTPEALNDSLDELLI